MKQKRIKALETEIGRILQMSPAKRKEMGFDLHLAMLAKELNSLEGCAGKPRITPEMFGLTKEEVAEFEKQDERLAKLRQDAGFHQLGCICADCSGAELTSEND